jgi:hypothetical protein
MSKANEANRSKEPKPTQTISDEQKQRLKRQLELEAYCALISAFRAQGNHFDPFNFRFIPLHSFSLK